MKVGCMVFSPFVGVLHETQQAAILGNSDFVVEGGTVEEVTQKLCQLNDSVNPFGETMFMTIFDPVNWDATCQIVPT